MPEAVSGGVVGALVPTALAWRRQSLPFAQTLAAKGELDAREVAAIAAEAGTSDNLRDVLDLVKLLTPLKSKVEALPGAGSPAAALGSLSTGRGASEAVQQAADLRDRYATLLVRWRDQLRAAFAGRRRSSMVRAGRKKPLLPHPPEVVSERYLGHFGGPQNLSELRVRRA